MNTANLWSDSLTKDILTKYAEGLACVRFDMRNLYDVRLYKKHHWFVMKKCEQKTDDKKKDKKKQNTV